jgi:hypothetical protein
LLKTKRKDTLKNQLNFFMKYFSFCIAMILGMTGYAQQKNYALINANVFTGLKIKSIPEAQCLLRMEKLNQ